MIGMVVGVALAVAGFVLLVVLVGRSLEDARVEPADVFDDLDDDPAGSLLLVGESVSDREAEPWHWGSRDGGVFAESRNRTPLWVSSPHRMGAPLPVAQTQQLRAVELTEMRGYRGVHR